MTLQLRTVLVRQREGVVFIVVIFPRRHCPSRLGPEVGGWIPGAPSRRLRDAHPPRHAVPGGRGRPHPRRRARGSLPSPPPRLTHSGYHPLGHLCETGGVLSGVQGCGSSQGTPFQHTGNL